MARENDQRVQRPTNAKPSESVPNGYDLPVPAEPPLVLDLGRALQSLISGTTPQSERVSLIEAIFSSRKSADMIRRLRGSDAQAFIDIVDEVRHHSSVLEQMGRLTLFSSFFILVGVGEL